MHAYCCVSSIPRAFLIRKYLIQEVWVHHLSLSIGSGAVFNFHNLIGEGGWDGRGEGSMGDN